MWDKAAQGINQADLGNFQVWKLHSLSGSPFLCLHGEKTSYPFHPHTVFMNICSIEVKGIFS